MPQWNKFPKYNGAKLLPAHLSAIQKPGMSEAIPWDSPPPTISPRGLHQTISFPPLTQPISRKISLHNTVSLFYSCLLYKLGLDNGDVDFVFL